jgi:hypothetical protein
MKEKVRPQALYQLHCFIPFKNVRLLSLNYIYDL